jgi:hypothetical protein
MQNSTIERHFLESCDILLAIVLLAGVLAGIPARATTLDFEGFSDSTILTNQYAGVTFSNAIILSAGISLNEFEFPPHSGTNVVSDSNGPTTVSFAIPVSTFSGYFTYAEPLTIQAFDSGSNQVASAASLFSNNEAMSGVSGSSPNELIQVMFAAGITSVTITGDPSGGSFVLDDVTYSTAVASTPEPAGLSLVLIGTALILMKNAKS